MVKYSLIKHVCQICKKESKQKSHHDTHLDSEHHKTKMELFRLKLDKYSSKKLVKHFDIDDKDKIMLIMSGIEPKYELKLQRKSDKVIYEFTKKELEDNKKYEDFKSKFRSKLKSWHNKLSGAGVTGDPALDDIINIIMLCYLDKNADKFGLYNLESYKPLNKKEFAEHNKYFKISELVKSQVNLCRTDNDAGYSKIQWIGEFLMQHKILGKLLPDSNNFIKCKKENILYHLIIDINKFSEENHIFKYSDIIGIAYEFWINEYRGGGGKELGNFFTERRLMRMCFELLDKDDVKTNITNNSTIGDEYCGTFGFPLYLRDYLKEKYNIKIKKDNIYGVEFEDKASRMGILNGMFSLGNIKNIQRGDSFITNISPHLDISVHNVPFGGRMKYKHIKEHYDGYRESHSDIPEFDEIIKSKANQDATLSSQMVIYKTVKMGLCIIKDGQETTGTSKELIKYRKHFCDSVNIKKILKIPSGAFSTTGTKTICIYFVKDGSKTNNIQFLELDNEGNKISEICNVKYEDLEHNNYLWSPNTYLEDEEILKLKEKSKCEWKKLGDVCKYVKGENTNSSLGKKEGKYPLYYCSILGNLYVDTYKFDDEGIIINKTNGSGKCNVYYAKGKYSVGNTTLHFKSKMRNILTYYIFSYLKNNISYLETLYEGSNQKSLKNSILENIKIPTPSEEKQKETVEQIELFDNLIKNMEEHNKFHKEGMKIYLNMILKKETDNIKWEKIGDVCEIKNGKSITKDKLINGIYPVVGGGTKPLGNHNKFNINENTILISKDGANAGYVSIYNKKIFATGHCLYIDNIKNKINKNYLYYILKNTQNNIYKLQKGGGQPGVNKNDIMNSISIPILSEEKQKEIVKYLDSINELIEMNNKKIDEYKENIKQILELSYS
jgi:restriction endonuclease S subunit